MASRRLTHPPHPPTCQVDTMIVQAIGLLDDLDKELNTYAMRVREWYGWHFPEMTKVREELNDGNVMQHSACDT